MKNEYAERIEKIIVNLMEELDNYNDYVETQKSKSSDMESMLKDLKERFDKPKKQFVCIENGEIIKQVST